MKRIFLYKLSLIILFISIVHMGYSQDTAIVIIKSKKQITDLCVSKFVDGIYYAGNCNNIKDVNILLDFDSIYYNKYIIFKSHKGKIIQEGYRASEFKDGYLMCYYKNGEKKSEGVYYFNEKIGLWKYFDKQGKLVKTEKFVDENNVLGTEKKYPILTLESN